MPKGERAADTIRSLLESEQIAKQDLESLSISELEKLIDNWMDAQSNVTDKATAAMIAQRVKEAEAILQKKKKGEADTTEQEGSVEVANAIDKIASAEEDLETSNLDSSEVKNALYQLDAAKTELMKILGG